MCANVRFASVCTLHATSCACNVAVCVQSQPHTFHATMVMVSLSGEQGLVFRWHVWKMRIFRGEFVEKFLDFQARHRVLYHLGMGDGGGILDPTISVAVYAIDVCGATAPFFRAPSVELHRLHALTTLAETIVST